MPMVQHQVASVGGPGSSLAEAASFFERMDAKVKEERDRMEAKDAKMEARLDAKDAKMEAKMEAKDAKMEEQRKEMETKIAELTPAPPAPPAPAITDEQLAALQARIEGLHVTKLLTDEDLFALEDLVADYVDLTMSVADGIITKDMIYSMPTVAVASKLDKLVGLSAAMAGDAAFARQARRKFL